jgi:hypothetical protein
LNRGNALYLFVGSINIVLKGEEILSNDIIAMSAYFCRRLATSMVYELMPELVLSYAANKTFIVISLGGNQIKINALFSRIF